MLVLPSLPLLGIALSLIVFILLLAFYIVMMSQKMSQLSNSLRATQLALAKEQKLSSFGVLAAAAAHELGSPLNTISLAAKDILSTLSPDSPLLEDVQLVVSQGDRCRDILADLSQSIRQGEGHTYQSMPLSSIIERAAESHKLPHISLDIHKESPDPEPHMAVTPDLMHGLGNVLQNAFQFATSTVRVTLRWNKDDIEAIIQDDGRGYPLSLLPRLGEPKPIGYKDPKEDGSRNSLGLGLFIAKTLLSQRQGQVHFSNDGGARCLIKWPRAISVVNSETKNQDSNNEDK